MPNSYLKKLAAEGHGTVAELEKKWDAAKAQAKKAGHDEDYGYITSIFQNMAKIRASIVVEAAQRLKGYAPQPNVNWGQTSELHGSENAYLDSLVSGGKFTREEVDKAWAEAKETANKNAKDNPNIVPSYAYTTAIFQSILGIRKKASVEIRAFARLASVGLNRG